MKRKFKKNLAILKKNDIHVCSTEPLWEGKPDSVELHTYTDGGEDMVIDLDEPTRECLEKYCDDFDINETVMLWWQNGQRAARERGVPFDNIKDHYEDYEKYLAKLCRVAELLD